MSDVTMTMTLHARNTETGKTKTHTIHATEALNWNCPGDAEQFGSDLTRDFEAALYAPRKGKS